MNRRQRRQADKMFKQKLTAEQYADMRSKTVNELAVKKFERFVERFSNELIPVMRANKISEGRVHKIIQETLDRVQYKYGGDEA